MRFLIFILLALLSFTSKSQDYSEDHLVVRINHKLLDWDKIDDDNVLSDKLVSFLNSEGREELSNLTNLPFRLDDLYLTKLFPHLRTKDSISLGRQGNIVYTPPFWATFKIYSPAGISLYRFHKILKGAYPIVIYNHANVAIESNSGPNDTLYSDQHSLYSDSFPDGHINVHQAWQIETGKQFIKVGVFDTGLDTTHEDLNVLGGWGYYNDLNNPWGIDTVGHGTPVAGIIGAKRNNALGIAGIAGGSGPDSLGVSILDFKYDNNYTPSVQNTELLAVGIIDAARSVGNYHNWEPSLFGSPSDLLPYYHNAPGYGIHIGNHSYSVKRIASLKDTIGTSPHDKLETDPGLDVGGGDGGSFTSCNLCKEAFLFSMKNGVVNVVSRGNILDGPTVTPNWGDYVNVYKVPAAYHDSWVINVGASGTDGNRLIGGVNTGALNEGWFSPQGHDIDIVAPGTRALVKTLKSAQQDTTQQRYKTFNGTSASAPHASGVAALLLSRYNDTCYSQTNLDPADIEYILQKSATDVDSVGYDINTGWGKLDAYNALKMIDFPLLQIVHPHDSLLSSVIIDHDTIHFHLYNSIIYGEQGPISSSWQLEEDMDYKVERLKIRNTYYFGDYVDPNNTDLLDVWIRHSQTNSLGLMEDTSITYNSSIQSYEIDIDTFRVEPMAQIESFTDSTITMTGYYYHFIAKYDPNIESPLIVDNQNYWYPVNPNIITPKMAYSIYIRDSTLVDKFQFTCDSIANYFDSTYFETLDVSDSKLNKFSVYPNPTSTTLNISIQNGLKGSFIEIVSIDGKLLDRIEIREFETEYKFNVSEYRPGFYFVNLILNEGVIGTEKWIKR